MKYVRVPISPSDSRILAQLAEKAKTTPEAWAQRALAAMLEQHHTEKVCTDANTRRAVVEVDASILDDLLME